MTRQDPPRSPDLRISDLLAPPSGTAPSSLAGFPVSQASLLVGLQRTAGNQAVKGLIRPAISGQQRILQRQVAAPASAASQSVSQAPGSFTPSYIGKEFQIDDDGAWVQKADGTPRVWAAGDTIPSGKKVGDRVVIPAGTMVKVLGTRGDSDADRLVNLHGWGWTRATSLVGNFHGETLSRTVATYLSLDPAHKTVGNPKATIRAKSTAYPLARPPSVIPKDTVVKIVATGSDGMTVRLASTTDTDLGWTRRSNVAPTPDGLLRVTSSRALRRTETVGYASTGSVIPIGTLVIVEEQSAEPGQQGKFVRVAATREDAGKRVQGEEFGWTAAANLVDGWTEDIHSSSATWNKGAFTGQISVVDIVNAQGSTRQVAESALSPFRRLQEAAKAKGFDLQIASGFRTYEQQRALREKYEHNQSNLAAKAAFSNHENGIALDLNTGGFDTPLYEWMTQNAPGLGYLRTVGGEHWHWEYHPDEAAGLAASHNFKRAGVNP